jgi:cellulose synthase/poly-beta-1,6-N-acetylglucosamine synthase-like glycosyltransferase
VNVTDFFFSILPFAYYVIFVGLHISSMIGISLELVREKKALGIPEQELPAVSVIIPVHNESGRMEGLLKSLEALNYPKAEYIFINDRSEDKSQDMIDAFIKKAGKEKARCISIKENPGPNHKQYALTKGIEVSSGEFLLFTDADCQLPPHWVRGMVKRMSDSKTGVIIGPVLKSWGGKGFFDGKWFFHLYQCYEHGIRFVYLAGATGLGAAGGGFGNNLILRRSCLEAVGGYENVPPSPTEDAALISRIRSCSDFRIRAALGKDVHVITYSEKTWKALANQTLRWNNGGLFSPDLTTRFNYNFLMITIAMGVLTLPLLPFFPFLWPLPAGVLTSMLFNNFANLRLFGCSLPKGKFGYALTLLFTPVYFTFLTILGYLGFKPKWKGQDI